MTIAITGLALSSPFGDEPDAFFHGCCHGPTPLRDYRAVVGGRPLACNIAALPQPLAYTSATEDLARRALADAGLTEPPHGTGLAVGSHWTDIDVLRGVVEAPHSIEHFAETLSLDGPIAALPVACASANHAMAWARQRLLRDEASVMIAGGLDLVGPMAAGAYLLFDNLAAGAPRPFSADRDGFLLAEGGALLVLEPLARAKKRGARIYAELLAASSAHDAAHPTRPEPSGRGLRRAIDAALKQAALAPAAIDYINAHSPGTHANDPVEAMVYRDVFGVGVPVSSTKSALGHAQGGANALEAVACILALRAGVLPPTLNTEACDPALGIDVIVGSPRTKTITRALSTAASMGGAYSVIILQKAA